MTKYEFKQLFKDKRFKAGKYRSYRDAYGGAIDDLFDYAEVLECESIRKITNEKGRIELTELLTEKFIIIQVK